MSAHDGQYGSLNKKGRPWNLRAISPLWGTDAHIAKHAIYIGGGDTVHIHFVRFPQ